MSQCWLNFGVLLWLSGNFVWMVGEFIVENPQHFLSGDAETFEVRSGQIFEECTSIAVPFLIAGCAWLGLYYIVRMFRQVPYFNRLDRFTLRQNENMPMPRFSLFFRDYSEYAMAYTFFWCLKDLLWAKFNIIGYGLVFVPTLLIFIDLVYITATHRGQFIEFFHNLICLVWLVANLLWAIAELVIPDKSVPFETRMIYCWPKTWTSDSRLYLRCAVGYLFMIALVLVCLFHLMWICMTFSGRLATQDIQMYYYSSDVGPGAGSHMAGSDLYNADADSIFSGALGALGLESGINLTTIDRHMESGINLTTIDRHPDTSWGEKSQLEAQNNRPSKSTAV
ncbi:hypothetical protein SARC_09326 [Sphaeroforma arctica JP610]|uniref:Uncharacterized protein n=1 Tax=Sphaeroforma arctica JP610 TaxID=667725 RepID=A0A0L0FN80_9EUKA|nr:hypothetical protein SARC_09326 [Sphaeroforma arctica JP610]KNC78232.1 hypothetical protein SARC_09326 [Sphaeroforma arctica JP610]|eukprot:XP_014152134.1 hypothetical protein SARC_09326 [Sphaeroforma arctica JP610]